jgi:two-component sensor histidine kinase
LGVRLHDDRGVKSAKREQLQSFFGTRLSSAGPLVRYAFAVALFALAALAKEVVTYFGSTLSYAQFYPVILLSALYGGLGPSASISLASILYIWWAHWQPNYWFGPLWHPQISDAAFFTLFSGLIIWVAVSFRKTRQRLELTLREMEHRGKNTFGVVHGIIQQSLPDDPALARTISDRVKTVSSVNDLIARSEDMQVELRALIGDKLAAFDRTDIAGPAVRLSPQVARNLSLLIHELCTNAVKYGALSSDTGLLRVRWFTDKRTLQMIWEESGGPKIEAPPRKNGFGSTLLRRLTAHMGGSYGAQYDPGGLKVKLTVRL